MGNRLILASLCAFWPAYAQIAITISPSPASVHVGTFLQLSARVSGTSTTGVTWSVTPSGRDGRVDLSRRPLYASRDPAHPQHRRRNGHQHRQPGHVRQRNGDNSESVP